MVNQFFIFALPLKDSQVAADIDDGILSDWLFD